jgi:hypothetical protein
MGESKSMSLWEMELNDGYFGVYGYTLLGTDAAIGTVYFLATLERGDMTCFSRHPSGRRYYY